MRTICPTCQEIQTLAEASVELGDETVYECKNGCQPILIVAPPNASGKPWPGRGFRVRDWVIRNVSDLLISYVDGDGRELEGGIKLPMRSAALLPEDQHPDA